MLTPGDLLYDETGRRLLRFNGRDGLGLALLCRTEVKVAILSGRPTDIAEARHRELGVRYFVSNAPDKHKAVLSLCHTMDIPPDRCAFMGDDLPDLGGFRACGLGIAVKDAALELKRAADWVTRQHGGKGAVREVCEAILRARGDWQVWLRILEGQPTTQGLAKINESVVLTDEAN